MQVQDHIQELNMKYHKPKGYIKKYYSTILKSQETVLCVCQLLSPPQILRFDPTTIGVGRDTVQ